MSKHNDIKGVADSNGAWVEDDNIGMVFTDYFQNLFESSSTTNVDYIAGLIRHKVPNEMINMITKPYTKAEINIAFNHMSKGKSLGPDGMTMEFYKNNWDIIDRDLIKSYIGYP